MPAEIITDRFCGDYWGSYDVVGSKGNIYVVDMSGTTGIHCTCPAFKYSKDQNCKHIKQVWEQACLWNPQWYDGGNKTLRPAHVQLPNEIPGQTCPGCGGPVNAVRIAV